MMKAIIQAGGPGTRLRPITYEIPKPLLTVRKKPILNYTVEFLKQHGVSEIGVIISAEHRNDFNDWLAAAKENISDGVSLFIENKPSGTFGWLRNLKEWLGAESFILANGDTLFDFNLKEANELHGQHKPIATIILKAVEHSGDYGTVSLDENNRILSFVEKPKTSTGPAFVSTGVYILEPAIFEFDEPAKDFLMIERDIFPALARSGKMIGAKINGRFYDCGTFERWENAIREW